MTTHKLVGRNKAPEASHPDFVSYVVTTYQDDLTGYMMDILGLRAADWQARVARDLMDYRRVSVQSGHGIGKTTFAAATIHWFLATRPHPAVVATANTESQLNTKLWRELAKINMAAQNGGWFEWTATRFGLKNDPTHFAAAIPWSENNAEAFAGTHEEHVLGVFDESSGIPPSIWTTFSGAMSTQGARWLALGNPTTNSGTFYETCNGRLRWRRPGDELLGKWKSHTVASFESPFVANSYVEEQKFVLGENSDEYRIRVLGLPPQNSEDGLLSAELIDDATDRPVPDNPRWPLILGVDVARQGKDHSCILPRRGKIVLPRIHTINNDTLSALSHRIAEEIHYYRNETPHEVQAVFIEGGGSVGWGVIEKLWELGYENVFDVNPGTKSTEPERFVNKRAEMWGYLKEWFETQEVSIPQHSQLREELLSIKRKPDAAMRLRLESKDELRRRTGKSPDIADALALTFAAPVELLPAAPVDKYDQYRPYSDTETSWMGA